MVDRAGRQTELRERGYNLVALMVLVAVINIGLAAALPSVTQIIKREKEAELIFRGLQYAEAIRVFQQRTGRYPVSLRELLKNNPRCIRQLWTDPFNDSGDWGLILAEGGALGGQVVGGGDPNEPGDAGNRRGRRRRSQRSRGDAREVMPTENVLDPDRASIPRSGQVVARGPILGVRSLSDEESVRVFMGSSKYNEWLFMVDLIPTIEDGAVGENIPRLHTNWVGKPFPEGLEPGGGIEGGEIRSTNPLDRRDRQRRGRRPSRRDRRSGG